MLVFEVILNDLVEEISKYLIILVIGIGVGKGIDG